MEHNEKIASFVPALLHWFAANARDLPWRRTRDPYTIWVSEIMLQQTQVKTVIPFWERWLRELPTIEAAASASPAKLHKLWEGLGYYTRVRSLQRAAQVIVARHAGRFPERFDDVLALPGIGRYTAGAICSIAFNQPAPILDGNVIRVLTRIFGIPENPKEKQTNQKLWQLAQELVINAQQPFNPNFETERERARLGRSFPRPRGKPGRTDKFQAFVPASPAIRWPRGRDQQRPGRAWSPTLKPGISQSLLTSAPTVTGSCSALNQSLMELGALVCTPRNPQCSVCPVQKLCVACKDGRIEELPNLGKREPATARRFMAFVIERNGKFLVRQRPAGVVNAHLWEFPNVEVNNGNTPLERLFKSELGFAAREITPLITIKHSITRYRITLEAFKATIGGTSSTSPRTTPHLKTDAVWKTPLQLRHLAFTSAHRKVLHAVGEDRG